MATIKGTLRNAFLEWCPPTIARRFRRVPSAPESQQHVWFRGDYASWDSAVKASTGYDTELILNKVLEATLKVKRGDAAFERDSVAFEHHEYVWPLVTHLMYAAARNRGRLHVVDFGGSLGSSFFQNRVLLEALTEVRWSVVEQPHFVEAGKREIEHGPLMFFDSLSEAVGDVMPQVLLLASMIQYLPDPYATLKELLTVSWQLVIVDRTAFVLNRTTDRLTVQTVPPCIYSASYPAWFLSKNKFLEVFAKDYELFTHWHCEDRYPLDGDTTSFEGFCFTRNTQDESP